MIKSIPMTQPWPAKEIEKTVTERAVSIPLSNNKPSRAEPEKEAKSFDVAEDKNKRCYRMSCVML